jgi:hypothetical protein
LEAVETGVEYANPAFCRVTAGGPNTTSRRRSCRIRWESSPQICWGKPGSLLGGWRQPEPYCP